MDSSFRVRDSPGLGQNYRARHKVEANKLMRKGMAIAAVPGLIAGIYIFVASFFGLTMDKLGAKHGIRRERQLVK